MHPAMAAALDQAIVTDIRQIQHNARVGEHSDLTRPRWPMLVLRSPKGWTGPKTVDGLPNEGTFRAHQVPHRHLRHLAAGALGAARNVAAELPAR